MPDKVRLKIWDTHSQYWVECFCEGGWSVRNQANNDWILMTQANTKVRSEDNTRWYDVWCPWDIPPQPPQTLCPCDDVVFDDAPCPTTIAPTVGPTVPPEDYPVEYITDLCPFVCENHIAKVFIVEIGNELGTVIINYTVESCSAAISVEFGGVIVGETNGYAQGAGNISFYKGTIKNVFSITVLAPDDVCLPRVSFCVSGSGTVDPTAAPGTYCEHNEGTWVSNGIDDACDSSVGTWVSN